MWPTRTKSLPTPAVRDEDKQVVTYAFLDQGYTHAFCNLKLVKALGISEVPNKLIQNILARKATKDVLSVFLSHRYLKMRRLICMMFCPLKTFCNTQCYSRRQIFTQLSLLTKFEASSSPRSYSNIAY